MPEGPLSGVKVVDLTHVWAGPLGTRILADLGAEVTKVESPLARGALGQPPPGSGVFVGGDPGEDPWNRYAVVHKLNRNKSSVAIDLKTPSGREVFLDLVREADVVVENFSARAMRSLDLSFESLRAVNDQIIYVAMPGYGSYGPYSNWVAFGPSVEPMTGWGAIIGYSADEPRNTAMALPDAISGVSAASAIVTALNRRRETGNGSYIELSLHEAGVSFLGEFLIERQLGADPQPIGNHHPAYYHSAVVAAAGEDEWVAVSCKDEFEFEAMCSIVGDDSARWDKHELAERLQASGIAAGPVNTAPDMLADEQLIARNFFVELAHEDQPAVVYPGTPLIIDGDSSHRDWSAAPNLGEHNAEVLKSWLGYDDTAVAKLREAGALVDKPPY
jgi:crotonobetainyl-CoA:carnitine CoA-transferase CaiB-like acyl-CoA transferase